MRTRLVSVLIVLAVLAASCGVSREDATVSRGATDAGDSASSDSGNEGDSDGDGGAGSSGGSDGAEEAQPAPTTPVDRSGPAATIVFADGTSQEISLDDLDRTVSETAAHTEFVNLVLQGSVPPDLESVVLNLTIVSAVMEYELGAIGGALSPEHADEARGLLLGQLSPLMVGSADPFADAERIYAEVPYLAVLEGLQARQLALTSAVEDNPPDSALVPCVRHILVDLEDEAVAVIDELDGGADFATLAAERSVGPSGPRGGDLGCAAASNYVPAFADAVLAASEGEVVGPVQTEFGWHVILVESYDVDATVVDQVIRDGLSAVMVTVNAAIGTWNPEGQFVQPAAAGG